MSQISANPWFFTNADQATSAAITSIANNVGSILITTTAAHGIVQDQKFSIQGTSNYNGLYRAIAVPTTTTILALNRDQNRGAAAAGAVGNVLSAAYSGGAVRAEQIYWQPSVAADVLLITDGAGNTVWNPKTTQGGATGGSFGPYAYGKVFWIQNGLVINTLPASNTLQITIN